MWVVGSAVSACSECDDAIQCFDTLIIHFDKATPWADGEYLLEVFYDDTIAHCDIKIPTTNSTELHDYCDDEHVIVSAGNTRSIVAMSISNTTPSSVRLVWSFEGVVFADETFEPDYSRHSDFPRECRKFCELAETTIMLP